MIRKIVVSYMIRGQNSASQRRYIRLRLFKLLYYLIVLKHSLFFS